MSFRVNKKGGSSSLARDTSKIISLIDEDFARTSTLADAGFNVSVSGAGSGSAVNTSTTEQIAGHPGVHELITGTTTSGRGTLITTGLLLLPSTGTFTVETIVKLSALSDGTNTYAAYIGSHNGSTSDPTYGIYFMYDSTTSANWLISASNIGTDTRTDSGIAVTTDWIKLKIVGTDSSVEYFINDVSAGIVTTNLPSAAAFNTYAASIQKSAGTTSRELWIDNVLSVMDLTSSRFG